jgi:hypothetical protein
MSGYQNKQGYQEFFSQEILFSMGARLMALVIDPEQMAEIIDRLPYPMKLLVALNYADMRLSLGQPVGHS